MQVKYAPEEPSVFIPLGLTSALRLGGFGYGKLTVDADGITRSVGDDDLEGRLVSQAPTRRTGTARSATLVSIG